MYHSDASVCWITPWLLSCVPVCKCRSTCYALLLGSCSCAFETGTEEHS